MIITIFNGNKNKCLEKFDYVYYDIPLQLSKLPTPVPTILDLPVA